MCLFRAAGGGAAPTDRRARMNTAIRLVLVAAIVAVLGYLAWPWLKHAMYVAELLGESAPQSLPMPVEGVPARAVRNSFGAPRAQDRTHQGIDIFAPRGTLVISTTRGIVTLIGENSLGGTVVWVLGPAGDRHYYAHLDRVADIQSGQRIDAGAVLGTVGTTGNARGTPPHLHYGIYRASGAINPFPLLSGPPPTKPLDGARRS